MQNTMLKTKPRGLRIGSRVKVTAGPRCGYVGQVIKRCSLTGWFTLRLTHNDSGEPLRPPMVDSLYISGELRRVGGGNV